MNVWCIWEDGTVCGKYDLGYFTEAHGVPYIEFSLGITLPYEVEWALIQVIAEQMGRNLI